MSGGLNLLNMVVGTPYLTNSDPSDPMVRHGSFGQRKEEPYFSRYLYAFKMLTLFLK